MTSTIRNLKRSPTGRESIRERDIEGSELSFGRDIKSQVQLQDLSVALHHAKLSHDETGQVFLHVNPAQQALVDGRIATGTVGPLQTGCKIKLGTYLITIEAASKKSPLVARLELCEDSAENISLPDEQSVFSLNKALPSKRILAWVFASAIAFLCLFLPIHINQNSDGKLANSTPFQADLFWNTGSISLLHSNLKSDCKSCHVNGWEAVTDNTCLDCHINLENHAAPSRLKKSKPQTTGFDAALDQVSETFGRPVDRCTSCHVEHNGRAHIMPSRQTLCSDCHAELDKTLPDTKLGNAADFGSAHPQFKPSVITSPSYETPIRKRISLDENPKGFSGLKFPHDIHLSKTGAVAQMASTLDSRFDFSDGVGCLDCHNEEAGGALFEPVSMTEDCAMCHSIVFENDDGFARTLRHGQPEEVIASMRDFYEAKALGNIRDAEINTTTRRRPGRSSQIRNLNRRELAFKQAENRTLEKVDAIFSEGGACYDCHVIDRPQDISSLDFKVRPISLNDDFYPRSPFNHERHEIKGLSCNTCHAAETSNSSDDVLLPKIEVCRDCHIGEESYRADENFVHGKFPTNCLTCHAYHDTNHGKEAMETVE